ncbi:hypothetical protein EW146_g5348 [Bondarzewia mesenterica]|uniref:Uncharacterized protein n=1 Tax=Bondarzewia mesenterica TaxID=1095465 RepID=A0A4S4LTN4_9AGAM|nr:hypothetical protein EW146_g5348 [Bondarzewia mesenterica]
MDTKEYLEELPYKHLRTASISSIPGPMDLDTINLSEHSWSQRLSKDQDIEDEYEVQSILSFDPVLVLYHIRWVDALDDIEDNLSDIEDPKDKDFVDASKKEGQTSTAAQLIPTLLLNNAIFDTLKEASIWEACRALLVIYRWYRKTGAELTAALF